MSWTRCLSYSEITAALTCEARWDFSYGDQLAGSSLRSRAIASGLSDGRAWGAAVAAWHAYQSRDDLWSCYDPQLARIAAHSALHASYRQDIAEQEQAGLWIDPELEVQRIEFLDELLEHYAETSDRLPNLTQLEGRFEVPLRSRSGRQQSTKYHFEGFVDGYTELDDDGGEWIVEFKLRRQLTPRKHLNLGRQQLWYAWARQQVTDRPVVGVIVDERLKEIPHPPRLVIASQTKDETTYRPSHSIDELTTEDLYVEACTEYGVEPSAAKLTALRARRWQQRVQILFRPGQLAEAGKELTSAGQIIAGLDRGDRWPVRNAAKHICNGCRYNEICPNPEDALYVDAIFERVLPKRDRQPAPTRA